MNLFTNCNAPLFSNSTKWLAADAHTACFTTNKAGPLFPVTCFDIGETGCSLAKPVVHTSRSLFHKIFDHLSIIDDVTS